MTSRMFAASIVLLGVGSMVAPTVTWAGSGGFIAAPLVPAGGAARPSISTRVFGPTSARLRLAGESARLGDFRLSRRVDRRQPGFPMWWGYAPYPTDYYPSEYAAQYGAWPFGYPPMENFSERSRPVVTYQPGCRTDTEKVPSESGGEHDITITRCY